MTCSVEGCEKKVGSRGLCSGHYHRLMRYGDAEYVPPPRPISKCSVGGCDSNVFGAGYCVKHYKRFRAHGDPLGGGIDHGAAQDFVRSLSQTSSDECIIWPFYRSTEGYGRMYWMGKAAGAHAVSTTLAHGEKPTKKHEACHTCGNGHMGCVNPRHLYWGTRKDNVRDAIAHGTASLFKSVEKRGEQSPSARYSDAVILEIRRRVAEGERQVDLAKEFGMSKTHVNKIKMGTVRTYIHANDNEPLRAAA